MNIDIKKIEALMEAMGRHEIALIKIKEGDQELKLEHVKGKGTLVSLPQTAVAPQAAPLTPPPQTEEAVVVEKGSWISSPMVGTFYRSPTPDSEPFVKDGDKVAPDTIVCIVEAMKVMNEVKAGISGVVRKVKPQNGDPVEYGTQMILVE